MNLPTEIFGDVVVVHTPEDMSEEQTVSFERFLIAQDRVHIVVDLNGTETIDSVGLTVLLDAQEAIRALGGDVRISTSNNVNRKIFEVTRLDQQLEVFDNVLDAVKSYA
jgi:anti-anti-sigma factor